MEIQTALVVDDSRVGRISLTKLLEKRSIQVVQKESGAAAIDYLKTNPADVVFIDYMMPEMDGVETARRLSADPATAHIPLYLYTGEEAGEAQRRAQGTGIRGFLSKPTPDDQLDRVLADAAGRQSVTAPIVTPAPAPVAAAAPDPAELEARARQAAAAVLEEALAGPLSEQIREAAQAAASAQVEGLRRELLEQAGAAARESAGITAQETREAAGVAARETAETALRQALPALEATARREAENAVKTIGTELWRELDRQLGEFLDSPALWDRLRDGAAPAAAPVDPQAVTAVARKVALETARAQVHEALRTALAEQAGSRTGATGGAQTARQAMAVAGLALAAAAAALVAALLL